MEQQLRLAFGPFCVDPFPQRLERGQQEVPLQPRPFAVLWYLLEHPGQLVTAPELMAAVWRGTVVTKTALRICIRAIRAALEDDARAPLYIETVGQKGYRFIAPVEAFSPSLSSRELPRQSLENVLWEPMTLDQRPVVPFVVGREAELAQLQEWSRLALNGQPQLVFVSGEPGIGKTTLVDLFMSTLPGKAPFLIGRGQCVEQFGEREAYLPMLEALEQLCRAPGGQQAVEVLHRYAPTWLLQMSSLVEDALLPGLQQKATGATRERMLREFARVVEALTADQGVVLVLEDLHASDHSTVELLAYLLQRREAARLLILGTYRPATLAAKHHPLREVIRELRVHRQCQELAVELLSREAIAEYLQKRLQTGRIAAALVEQTHQWTDGNALFLMNIVEYLLRQSLLDDSTGQWQLRQNLAEVRVPESLQQMIETQIEQLAAEERQLLVVASVQGDEFDSAVLATILHREMGAVEEQLEQLTRTSILIHRLREDELPDSTPNLRYRFAHGLYRQVMHASLASSRRRKLSGEVAHALQGFYGASSHVVAGELAHLYEAAREFPLAVQYYGQAAQHASQLFAYEEAMLLARRGLAMLDAVPDGPARRSQELSLRLTLGFALSVSRGYTTPEAGQQMSRARELCQHLDEAPQLFSALWGLWLYHFVVPDFLAAREIGEQLLRLAQRAENPIFLVGSHLALGFSLLTHGEIRASHDHLAQALTYHDSQHQQTYHTLYRLDPSLYCLTHTFRTLWLLGYPEQARRRMQEAMARLQDVLDPRSHAYTLHNEVFLHLLYGNIPRALQRAEEGIAYCDEHGIAQEREWIKVCRGVALILLGQVEEGLGQARESLATLRAMHSEIMFPRFLTLVAEALVAAGWMDVSLEAIEQALEVSQRTKDYTHEAEAYRLKGELALRHNPEWVTGNRQQGRSLDPRSPMPVAQAAAEACFLKAIDIARQQQAKMWELRATTSLARLWQSQGKLQAAQCRLAEVYNWFTEGFDTPELQTAKMLLNEITIART